jgi:hypothetical protein
MSLTTIVGEGCFDSTVRNQINANFTALNAGAVVGTLTSAHLLVGNASNVATDTAITGDVTIGNTGVTAIKTSVSLTTPVIGAATGTSLSLSGDCAAATFHAGATAGVSAGPFTTVASIRAIGGIVTTLTGS